MCRLLPSPRLFVASAAEPQLVPSGPLPPDLDIPQTFPFRLIWKAQFIPGPWIILWNSATTWKIALPLFILHPTLDPRLLSCHGNSINFPIFSYDLWNAPRIARHREFPRKNSSFSRWILVFASKYRPTRGTSSADNARPVPEQWLENCLGWKLRDAVRTGEW